MTKTRAHRRECRECPKYYHGIMPQEEADEDYLDVCDLCPTGEEIRFRERVLTKLSSIQTDGCVTHTLALLLGCMVTLVAWLVYHHGR